MKKFNYLLLLFALFFWNSSSAQVIATFPYTYDFENEGQGSTSCGGVYTMVQAGWFNDLTDDIDWTSDVGGTGSSGTGPSVDHTFGTSAGNYMYTETSGCYGDIGNLETPYFDFTAIAIPQLEFWYHMQGTAMGTMTIQAKIGANGTWNTVLPAFTDNVNAWQLQIVGLAAYGSTDSVKIRFQALTGTSFTSDMAIDDITVGAAPSCPFPTALAASNISGTTADIGWIENGTATNWQIEYGPVGFTQGTGTLVNAGTNPFTLTGLTSLTSYDFYVRAVCAPGDTSSWAGPSDFTTLIAPLNCTTGFVSTIFSEGFEGGYPSGWSNPRTSAPYWRYNTGGTGSSNTGPSAANGGSGYMYLETSGSTAGVTDYLYSPPIDLTAVSGNARMTFYYHMYGATIGTLGVEVSDDGGTTWNSVFSLSGQQQAGSSDPWSIASASLVPYIGSIIEVRFVGVGGSSFTGDLAIDDFLVEGCVTCPTPTNTSANNITATSADFNWTENGTATTWEIEYGPAGFAIGSGTIVQTTNNPYNVTGLTDNTGYEFYVRAICAPGDTSSRSPTGTFTTPCLPFLGDNSSTPMVIPSNATTFSDAGNTGNGCFTDVIANSSEDAWYEFIVTDPCATEISVTLCGSTYDTYLRIYDENLTQLAGNDDDCGLQSSINNFGVSPGDTLYIVVEGFGSGNGNYVFNFTQNVDTTVADIAYSGAIVCQNDVVATPINNGTTGGTFSELNGNTNLLLNTSTGEIDLVGTPLGSYDVVYNVALAGVPTCVDADTVAITIATFDTASISIGGTGYCQGLGQTITPSINAATGGFFFSPSIQLAIDSTTGVVNIDNSPLGTFAIMYQTTANGCIDRDTQVININIQDTANITYPQVSFCADDVAVTPTNNSTNGGSFNASPTGLMIDPLTGEIDPASSSFGVYTVDFTTSGTCSDTQSETITVSADDNSDFGYANATYCQSDSNPAPAINGLTGGTFSSPTGAIVDPSTGVIDLAASNLSTGHQISYTTNGPCPTTTTVTVGILSNCTTTNVLSSPDSKNSYKLYPNPNYGQFTIEMDGEASDATITVFNAIGQKVFEQHRYVTPTAATSLEITGLSAGNYMVQITDTVQTTVIKMVVTQP